MKSIIVFIFAILCFANISAQDENRNIGFSGGFEVKLINGINAESDYVTFANKSDFSGKSLRLTLGYFINPHVYGGLGFGADRYELISGNTFPLTFQARYYLKDAKNTIYAFGEAGPQLALSPQNSDKGFMSSIGVGYKFFAFSRTCFVATIGYVNQKSNVNGISYDNGVVNTFPIEIKRQSISFGLGMHF